MMDFREVLDFCGFKDLGYVGSPFTWCNNKFEGDMIGSGWIEGLLLPHGHKCFL